MKIEHLNTLQAEIDRFQKRLDAAKQRITQGGYYHEIGTKENGALRRGAHDLKAELNLLTTGRI